MDIVWCVTMQYSWAGKPTKNVSSWNAFSTARAITLFLSYVNIVLKAVACIFLVPILKGSKSSGATSNY